MRANKAILEVSVCLMLTGLAVAQDTQRVSVSSAGTQANGGSGSGSISADGRYVAFASSASDLVTGDANGHLDIFVRDLLTGTTERVNVDSSGTEANGYAREPSMSADGRFVVFLSVADNLVPGDLNGYEDVFVRDRQGGTTDRVSVATGGAESNCPSTYSSISPDGRFVGFVSCADNLVPGDTNTFLDVFVHDRQTGMTTRASVDSSGGEANRDSFNLSLSGDGRYVAFTSLATNLGPIDNNNDWDFFHGFDVFVHDCLAGTTIGVSVDPNGEGGDRGSEHPSISADGRYVVFESDAHDLVPGFQYNPYRQVFVRDVLTGTTTVASLNSSGQLGDRASETTSISADGRYVAFTSASRNFMGIPYVYNDVFVRDRRSGTTERVSVGSDGVQGDLGADASSISADGRLVAFSSTSTNLVPEDTNGYADVFVRDRAPAAVTAFCVGDGTGASCPCGNSGNPFRGCQNSANTGGSVLAATGFASVGQDTLRITSHGGRANALSLFLQGDTEIAAENFGDGLRCIGGNLKRLYSRNANLGIVTAPQGADPSISVRSAAVGDPIPLGATRYYQVYYRDPTSTFCPDPPGNTWNVSNALSAVWDP